MNWWNRNYANINRSITKRNETWDHIIDCTKVHNRLVSCVLFRGMKFTWCIIPRDNFNRWKPMVYHELVSSLLKPCILLIFQVPLTDRYLYHVVGHSSTCTKYEIVFVKGNLPSHFVRNCILKILKARFVK